jgi:hypothetical protein
MTPQDITLIIQAINESGLIEKLSQKPDPRLLSWEILKETFRKGVTKHDTQNEVMLYGFVQYRIQSSN